MMLASATAVTATVSTAVVKAFSPEVQRPQTSEVATMLAEAVPTASAVASAVARPETETCVLPWPVQTATTSATASAMAEATVEARVSMGTVPLATSLHATSASSTTARAAGVRRDHMRVGSSNGCVMWAAELGGLPFTPMPGQNSGANGLQHGRESCAYCFPDTHAWPKMADLVSDMPSRGGEQWGGEAGGAHMRWQSRARTRCLWRRRW